MMGPTGVLEEGPCPVGSPEVLTLVHMSQGVRSRLSECK